MRAITERTGSWNRRRLGDHGPAVSAIGLGCMGMSDFYGPADEGESIATIHAALDAGIDLIDTGDFYGMGHNEMLIGRALKGKRAIAPSSRSSSAPSAGRTAPGWAMTRGRPR